MEILQEDMGAGIKMQVGQRGIFPDLPDGTYEVITSAEGIVEQAGAEDPNGGVSQENLQIGAVALGQTHVVIVDFDSGDRALEFDVRVLPAG